MIKSMLTLISTARLVEKAGYQVLQRRSFGSPSLAGFGE
jgi:hypothetical protein